MKNLLRGQLFLPQDYLIAPLIKITLVRNSWTIRLLSHLTLIKLTKADTLNVVSYVSQHTNKPQINDVHI